MNLFTKQKQSHRCRKQTGYQEGKGGKDRLGSWDLTYTHVYVKQIATKNLLYSTGTSTYYSAMTYMGKESKKEWISYMHN